MSSSTEQEREDDLCARYGKTADESFDLEKREEVTAIVLQVQDELPEGGLQAWLTVFGAFLIQFTTFGYISSFGVFQDFYVRRYLSEHSPSTIGWIGGVQLFFNYSIGVFAGRAFDRGYFYHLVYTGALLNAMALFMLSLSHEGSFYQVFFTNGVALGLSGGLCYIPTLGIATHYFRRKRTLAIGFISSGTALGAIVHPIILNKFFNGPIGFHHGVCISGGINTALLVVACCIIRTRLPPKTLQTFHITEWFKEPSYLAVFVAGLFIFLGLFYPLFYLQLSAITHGVNPNFAFYSISILNAASFCGRILPGILGPRFGVLNLSVIFVTSSGIVAIFMMLVKNVVGIVFFAILFGVTSGSGIALFPSVIAILSTDINELGTRMGICFLLQGIVGLFASPISGALLTKDFHWFRADLFSGIALIVAGCCFAISTYFFSRKRKNQSS